MVHSMQKTLYLIVAFLMSCASVILSAVAYGTEYWIQEEVVWQSGEQSEAPMTPPSNSVDLHLGLFHGVINKRVYMQNLYDIWVKEEYDQDHSFMNFGLWVCTLLFLSLGILFGVICAIFAGVNSAMTPIEEITGVRGIYLWNGLALIFTFTSAMLWLGEYYSHFINILSFVKDQINLPSGFNTNYPSSLGYSYYLVVVAIVLYLINNIFIFLSTFTWEVGKKSPTSIEDKPTDGIIMLY